MLLKILFQKNSHHKFHLQKSKQDLNPTYTQYRSGKRPCRREIIKIVFSSMGAHIVEF